MKEERFIHLPKNLNIFDGKKSTTSMYNTQNSEKKMKRHFSKNMHLELNGLD